MTEPAKSTRKSGTGSEYPRARGCNGLNPDTTRLRISAFAWDLCRPARTNGQRTQSPPAYGGRILRREPGMLSCLAQWPWRFERPPERNGRGSEDKEDHSGLEAGNESRRDTQGAEGDPDKIDASRVLTLKSVTLATELTRRTSPSMLRRNL